METAKEIEELPKTVLDHIEVCIIPENAEERYMADLRDMAAWRRRRCRQNQNVDQPVDTGRPLADLSRC